MDDLTGLWDTGRSWFWLGVILVTLTGVAIGKYPGLRMNRASICLVGATVLVASGAIGLDAAFRAIDMNTITLLFAMMVINANLRLSGFFQLVAQWTMRRTRSPTLLLAAMMAISAFLSALFLNDTVVLVFTPLILEVVLAMQLPPVPFLVGLALSANIGSVATLIGNPQNMLIGLSSGIPFTRFSWVLAPVAMGGVLLAWLVVAGVYRSGMQTVPVMPETMARVRCFRPLMRKTLLATVVMLAALLAGVAVPLAALSGAALLLTTRRLHPERVFREIDWTLLVFFAALFVVTGAIESAGFGPALMQILTPLMHGDVLTFTVAGVVLSNVVSNVPAVLLVRPVMETLADPERQWLMLAMVTTFAGNLTLLGSVCNLIVAESARAHGVELSFNAYLRAGLPVTLVTLLWGVFWITRG